MARGESSNFGNARETALSLYPFRTTLKTDCMLRTYCTSLLYCSFLVWLVTVCYGQSEQPATAGKEKKKSFELKETIITGKDTGMYSVSGFQSKKQGDILCQRWELDNNGYDYSDFNLHELDLFKDSTALRNGRGPVRIG